MDEPRPAVPPPGPPKTHPSSSNSILQWELNFLSSVPSFCGIASGPTPSSPNPALPPPLAPFVAQGFGSSRRSSAVLGCPLQGNPARGRESLRERQSWELRACSWLPAGKRGFCGSAGTCRGWDPLSGNITGCGVSTGDVELSAVSQKIILPFPFPGSEKSTGTGMRL